MNIQKFTTFKTILIALVLTINANQLFAQTTNGIFFQAVARDNFSNPAKDRKIYVQSSIIQTTPTGTKVLTEEHQANTDATGVFSISLGNGVRVGGTATSLTTIDWSKGPFYLNLKVAITPIGGNSNWDYTKEWVDMGTTSFGAVPFALYSASSAKVDDKLNVSDTSTMLKVYAKAIKVQSLETSLATKLTAADTLTMLAPYAKAAYTIDSSFFKSQLATKLSLTDTINYTKQKYTDSAIAKKLNIADSAIYVTKTQLASYNFSSGGGGSSIDTSSLSSRINLKANASDITTLNTNISSNTASITSNATAINLKAPIASPLFSGSVAIGTTTPSSSAVLDITSTSQGLLLPRLTYVQKTAITSPVAGLVLWCSDCGTSGEMQVYNGASFVNIVGGPAQFALPVISSTSGAYSITTSAAMSGGVITSDGGASITARGIVWGTSTAPTIALATKTTDGTGTGTYSSSITGLTSGVTYYLRAYATNSLGTKYGSEITLNTAQAVATLAATTPVSAIGSTTATSGGNITYNGGATVTVSGVVWSTTSTPTISDSKTTDGTANGTYTSTITGLTPGTLYYVRSYATNSVGTSYGTQTSFTTLNTATISATTSATAITSSTATTGGTITADGGSEVTARGVVYGTSAGASTFSVTTGTGTGTFTSSLTGLTPATTYYVRSFATNSVGTVYGTETSFSTIAIAPTLTTTAASSITKYAASAGGTISSNGGSTITVSGICWSTTATPTTSNFKTTDGTTSGTFTSSITGLTAGTTYYVRAYATNAIGTSYGAAQSFTTLSSSSNNPVLASTTSAASITANSAMLGGNVTDEGSTEVSVRGLVYGTSTGSSTFSVTLGSGAGTFTSTLTGLTQGATYYVRSFATNVQGTSYGAETSFTTQTIPTVSVTATPTSITTTTAIGGGTISSTGGATITSSGLVWDANANPEITLTTKTTDGSTSGTFTSSITGLTPGTLYYVRSYATNSVGTNYGAQTSFTTLNTPTITATASATSITSSTATSGGTITTDGGAAVTSRGIVYGTTTESSTFSVTSGTGTGTYTISLTGLTPATTYYVRSFATNSVGTVYGTENNFTTIAVEPTVSATAVAASITGSSAISGGTISSNGGATVTVSGIVWSTTSTPTIALLTKTTNGAVTGTYTSSITDLAPATLYYVRAYATNSIGTAYGPERNFTTLAIAPIVSATASATSITSSTASIGGTITSDGGAAVTSRGVVYGTSSLSTTFSITSGIGTGTYTSSLTGLTPATTYYVRSFATNSIGTVYGTETSFTTIAIAPTLTTTAASSITKYAASAGGTITSNGGSVITASGICWSTTATPTISDSKTTDGTTSGTFTSSITGLTAGTTYYVRAYATNAIGTSYGTAQSFTTLSTPPSQTTVLIGTQTWTDKNLNVSTYRNGDAITYAANATQWNVATNAGIGAWAYYDFNESTGLIFGKLYNWYAVNDTRGLAPSGYHIPTKVEFNTLASNSGSDLKAASSEWGASMGSNTTGFTGLPGGNNNITSSNRFEDKGTSGWFWTSEYDVTNPLKAYFMLLHTSAGLIDVGSYLKTYGMSVRLVKDNNLVEASPTNPVLASTTSATSITANSAILGGNISDEGATQVSARGLVYGTTTGASTFSVTVGSGGGTFTGTLTGLTQGTTYFVRSFATNMQGTSYGAETSFTTQTTPTVSVTATPTSISTTTAIGGGTISSTGGATITTSGLVWGASTNPEITLSTKTTNGATSGTFTSSITGLTQGATYYVRAYATNSIGTGYGPNITFTTVTTPTVSGTATVTSITGTSATGGGTISSDGGATVTSRGLVWGTTSGATTFSVTSGTGIGTYTASLTGLSIATTYFVRPFAINSAGTVYGPEVSFATPNTATVASTITSTITSSTAILGGVLSSTGGATTTIGIMYSTSLTFGTSTSTIINANASAGTYTTSISGLSAVTTYYAKAYATNTAGTTYGPTISFTTPVAPIAVGASYGGGKVFYIFQPADQGYVANETHGLIAATVDQSTGIRWNNGSNITTGATGTAIGTGFSNTNTIITSQGETATSYAAGLARAYRGGGYDDWYLPSRDELNLLYTQKVMVGGFESSGGAPYVYFSSTETSFEDAHFTIFENGTNYSCCTYSKKNTTTNKVRAIRKF